jgi:hypothetical protein
VLKYLFSATSSTVADPSTVTVRIESASTSDLNVQDVVTTSSSDDDDDNALRQQNNTDRLSHPVSNRRHTSALTSNNASLHHHRPTRLSTDVANSIRVPQSRPITAVSLPAKPSAFDNEWDFDSARTLVSTSQRRNPSCPSIPPITTSAKPTSQPILIHQQVPTVFTTTSECLGKDFRPQPRRDLPRRSQSLAKQIPVTINSASPTVPIVFLTDDILLGSVRALQNERQLCRLSVDYLIDATNMRPDELARKANVGVRLPCHCGHTHSRCTLTLEFDRPYLPMTSTSNTPTIDYNKSNNSKTRELSQTQLGQLFSVVNRFISKAQQEEKRILIYGFELTTNSPLAVIAIQYLMLTGEQLSLTEATNRIHRLFPMIPLQHQQYPIMEKHFQDYLKQLDRKIFPRNFITNSISVDGSSSGTETRQSPREISWESSELTATSTPVTSWTTIPIPIVNNNTNSSHHLFPARSAWDV